MKFPLAVNLPTVETVVHSRLAPKEDTMYDANICASRERPKSAPNFASKAQDVRQDLPHSLCPSCTAHIPDGPFGSFISASKAQVVRHDLSHSLYSACTGRTLLMIPLVHSSLQRKQVVGLNNLIALCHQDRRILSLPEPPSPGQANLATIERSKQSRSSQKSLSNVGMAPSSERSDLPLAKLHSNGGHKALFFCTTGKYFVKLC